MGGSRVILVIIRLHTRSHVASVPLMSPGMMAPAAIPAADLAKALVLLRDYRIQAGGTSPTTLPVVINGTTWSLASTENGLLTLLRNGSAKKSFNISEVRKDPFRISATRLTQDNRYLLVEFYRGEGSSRAGIAEREWYYNIVVFVLK